MSGAPTFDTEKKRKKQKRGEFITPPRPTGRRSNYQPLNIDIYLSGLLARRQNAWSQDGGNMRVIANGVNR